jgi:drug/metabolite transporter (DMT)-like permease
MVMRYYGAIFTTIVFFSTIEVVVKLIGPGVDPIFLAFIRFFAAGMILTALDLKKVSLIRREDIPGIILLALIGVSAGFAAFHTSLKNMNASTGAVIFSMNPIFSSVAALYFLKEKLTLKRLFGTIIGFAGVYLLSFGLTVPDFASAKGPLLMLFSSITFSIYIAGTKLYVKKIWIILCQRIDVLYRITVSDTVHQFVAHPC